MKVNVTGFTNQQRTGLSKKEVIGLNTLLPEILKDNGFTPVRDEKGDVNIVSVLDLSSINASNAVNCLELLRNEKCIIAFDDWNIKGFYKGIDKILETKQFSKTHHSVDYKGVLEHLDVIEKLANGEYPAIYPAYKTGNHELLEIRGEKFCLDPSVYIELPELPTSGDLIAVHASLATKWSDLNKKKYTILNIRNETEPSVYLYYCKYRIVMTPPHYHDMSGWWRNRYTLANKAKAVIIEDDFSVFGDSYGVQRRDVNFKTINGLFELQDEAYNDVIMTKDEISKILKEIL